MWHFPKERMRLFQHKLSINCNHVDCGMAVKNDGKISGSISWVLSVFFTHVFLSK